MKKVLMLLVSVLLLTGCSFGTSLKKITYDELNQKMKNKETFVLYIGSKDCSHCAEFKPTLETVIKKYKLEVYYIDMSLVSEEQYNAVKEKTGLNGTPTVLVVEKGKSKSTDRIVGTKDEESVIEFFKEINIIKGD